MKVRIGVAAGPGVVDDTARFFRLVDALDGLGYDSVWVPDVITTPTLDPIPALAAAAGRRQRLKIGTHLVLPGRNPVLLAKQLATLDRISDGRLLLLAVLGLRRPEELAAQGVEPSARPKMMEEMLTIMRGLWAGETVSFDGDHYRCDQVQLSVVPVQSPLEVWLGGQVPAALRRCGRIGEGWMPGLSTPTEAAEAKAVIDAAADDAGRTIDDEHFGVNISWVDDSGPGSAAGAGPLDERVVAAVRARRPKLDAEGLTPDDLVARGVDGLKERVEAFLDVGFSKFVIRPAVTPDDWAAAVERVSGVLELQS